MMDCTQYRRSILADPLHPSAEMRAHGATCHECAEYTARLLRFESRLDRALRVVIAEPDDAEAAPSGVILPSQPIRSRTGELRRLRRRAWAIAASVLAGAVIAGAL